MKRFLTLLFFVLISCKAVATAPISAEHLFTGPDHYSMKLSPNGKFILTYDYSKDFDTLELVDPIKKEQYPLLELEHTSSIKIESYEWVNNSTVYVQLGDRNGFLHIDYSGKYPIGKWKEIKSTGYLVATLPNEETILYAYKETKNSGFHKVYKATIEDVETNQLDKKQRYGKELKKGLFYIYDPQSDAILSATLKDEKIQFWYLTFNAAKWKKFIEVDRETKFTPVGFLSENKLAVLTNQDLNLVSLLEFDIKTQTMGEILYQHPMYDLTDATLNPIGQGVKSVQFVDHGVPKSHYFNQDDVVLDETLKRSFEDQQVTIIDASLDNNFKIIATFASNNPGTFYYFDAQQKEAIYIKSRFTSIEDYSLTQSTTFEVAADDGTSLEAILTIPDGNLNGVLLVYPHGGPVGVRDFATFNPEIQYLASRGYSILNVNFRGSSGFGKAFLETGKEQFGRLIEKDITAVVNKVKQQHQFDKMCSIGGSYGGYSAVMLAMYHPQDYQCVVSLFGIYDLPHLFNATNYKTLEENRKGIAEVVGDLDASLEEISPFYFAEKLQSPILLMAGMKDEVADFEQANRMKYRLQQLDKDIEYLFYQNSGHGHSTWTSDRHQFAFIDDYIRRKLDLPYPKGEQAELARREDFMAIADAYDSKTFAQENNELALKYYQKAAELGHGRAIFNIGSYHHRGEILEKDISKAIEFYKKSLTAGYAGAGIRLGDLYRDDKYIEPDFDYSFQSYQKSKELDDKVADLYLGQAHCLGEGVKKDIDICLTKLFSLDNEGNKKKWLSRSLVKDRNKIIVTILWSQNFTQQELGQFNQMLIKEFTLDVVKLALDDVEYGIYKQEYFRDVYTKTAHEETTTIVPLEKDALFGAIITLDAAEDHDVRNPRTMIKLRWTAPEEVKPYTSEQTRIVKLRNDIIVRFSLNQEHELIEGDWTLDIEGIDGTTLFSKTFTVVDSSKEDPALTSEASM
jgi:dipeptidyl aminopeptidase/acylaminoacyl peptidase